MSYSTDRNYSATIEIVATSRAKEMAAKKCKIPFQYGDEIDTYGVLFKNPPKHVHVDTSTLSHSKRLEYFSLVKKYFKKEFNKMVNPPIQNFCMAAPLIILGCICAVGLSKCLNKKEPAPTPQPIQKSHVEFPHETQKTR